MWVLFKKKKIVGKNVSYKNEIYTRVLFFVKCYVDTKFVLKVKLAIQCFLNWKQENCEQIYPNFWSNYKWKIIKTNSEV